MDKASLTIDQLTPVPAQVAPVVLMDRIPHLKGLTLAPSEDPPLVRGHREQDHHLSNHLQISHNTVTCIKTALPHIGPSIVPAAAVIVTKMRIVFVTVMIMTDIVGIVTKIKI